MKFGINDLTSENIKIDIAGIKSLLKPECEMCDIHEKIKNKERCKGCIFILNSAQKKGKPSRIGCSSILTKYGILHPNNLGKLHLFFFLHHPELNFQFPDIPEVDIFGNTINDKLLQWHIHHINGVHYDDSKDNQLLALNTEHGYLTKKPDDTRMLYEIIERNEIYIFDYYQNLY